MARILRGYLRLLDKQPLLTMSSTTGVLMASGDAIAQQFLERNKKGYDVKRTARFFCFGLCFAGPTLRYWYVFLDKTVKGTTLIPALKKVVLDQTFMSPFFIMCFIVGLGGLRGDSLQTIKSNVNRDFLTVLLNNYKLWPAVQIVNFSMVPLQHRILVVNFVALGWNSYLAYVNERTREDTDTAEDS